ncbi:MAG: cytochrome P450, partial [Actinomycetota bacterium]
TFDRLTLTDLEGFWAGPRPQREGVFAQLRASDELFFSDERGLEVDGEVVLPPGPGFWSLVRHADVVEASKQPDLFCSGEGSNIGDLPVEMREFFGSMINMDDPRHARLRRIVSRGFTPRMVEKLNDAVVTKARSVIDGVAEQGSIDFVTEVAAKLPLALICDLMGIPESDYELVFDMTNIILSNGDPEFIEEGANPIEAFLTAGATLAGLMQSMADERRQNPTDDLTTALITAEVDGEMLSDEELSSFFVLLCAAGNETTRNATSHGLRLLTENPDQRAILMDDFEGRIGDAVEEIVRLSSPVIHFRRTVTRDGVQLGDHTFNEGDKVVLWYGSANRDERIFDRPHEMDITRNASAQVGFGGPGPHFCLGAHFARRQLATIFRELLHRLPDIEMVGEPDYLRSNFINGIKHMDAEFTPAG